MLHPFSMVLHSPVLLPLYPSTSLTFHPFPLPLPHQASIPHPTPPALLPSPHPTHLPSLTPPHPPSLLTPPILPPGMGPPLPSNPPGGSHPLAHQCGQGRARPQGDMAGRLPLELFLQHVPLDGRAGKQGGDGAMVASLRPVHVVLLLLCGLWLVFGGWEGADIGKGRMLGLGGAIGVRREVWSEKEKRVLIRPEVMMRRKAKKENHNNNHHYYYYKQ